MLIVVADTSPLRYLVQIDQIQLLPRLFEKILIPSVVSDELRHPSAPEVVRNWMSKKPDWLEVSVVDPSDDPSLRALDDGERSAISLGLSVSADLILIDDRRGAVAARDSRPLMVIKTTQLRVNRHAIARADKLA